MGDSFLLFVGDREPVFHEQDAGIDQHLLEQRAGAQEFPVFLVGAEAHHPFDPRAVVPGTVEEHDLALARQVRNVALKVPLAALAFGRRAECHHAADAGVEAFGDALDDAAFARRVTPFEDHHDAQALLDHPVLQLDELELQPHQFVDVALPPGGLAGGAGGGVELPRRFLGLGFPGVPEDLAPVRQRAVGLGLSAHDGPSPRTM
jgi:hypothetical protein